MAPARPRCTDSTTYLLYPHGPVVRAVAAAPPASRGTAPPPGPAPPPGRPGKQRERLSGGAGPSVRPSGRASLPAAATARARSCRAPPLLSRRRRAAPGASPLGLHRRLPPPPPLSPPFLRRCLHGARPDGKCRHFRPASTSARRRFRLGVVAPARGRARRRRRGRHGDGAAAAMAAPPESLLRYSQPVLVSRRGDRASAGVSGEGRHAGGHRTPPAVSGPRVPRCPARCYGAVFSCSRRVSR